MVLGLFLAATSVVADWVPARWASNDPKSLELVAETPINCLLLEEPLWSAGFSAQAAGRGVNVLGIVRPVADLAAAARRAAESKLTGLVLEGDFETAAVQQVRSALSTVIELPSRSNLRFDARPVAGTTQGIWPGVRTEIKAAATGGPWIDTNSGFLRFVRAATDVPVWMGNVPPLKMVIPAARYLQAIADAELCGARWILALDEDFSRRLLGKDATALRDWKRIAAQLRFFEEHKEWRAWRPYGRLAVVQDPDSGAMLTGGILDMIATKHTPVRPVPRMKVGAEALQGARMAVNVDPASLAPEQKEALRVFTRGGGTLLNGPPGWKFPVPRSDRITLEKKEQEQIDDIWKDINSMIGRTNLGARLFNVAGMLSNLIAEPGGKRVVLELVNYTDYPIESVTVHMLGKFTRAQLLTPENPPRALEVYPVEEGSGIDIPQVGAIAALVLEPAAASAQSGNGSMREEAGFR